MPKMKKTGFKNIATAIAAKERAKGHSAAAANRMAFGGLANAARKASPAAKRKNPNLKKVKGGTKKK